MRSSAGTLVPLAEVAALQLERSPRLVRHHGQQRCVDVDVVPLASADRAAIVAAIEALPVPAGMSASVVDRPATLR